MSEAEQLGTFATLVLVGVLLVVVALLAFAITRTGYDVKYWVSISPTTELFTELVAGVAGCALLAGCAMAAAVSAASGSESLGTGAGVLAGAAVLTGLIRPGYRLLATKGPVYDARRRRRERR